MLYTRNTYILTGYHVVQEGKQYKIVAAAHGRHMVTEAAEMRITSEQDLERAIEIANSNKAVAKTDMNARSSRSHTVFTLRITGCKRTNDRAQVLTYADVR